jgi:hypothetical protein
MEGKLVDPAGLGLQKKRPCDKKSLRTPTIAFRPCASE